MPRLRFRWTSRSASRLGLWLAVLPALAWGQFWLQPLRLPSLPDVNGQPNPGVAGAFAGLSHGALLVAGGANFPAGYPWQGGQKAWHTDVYVLTKPKSGYVWQTAEPLGRPLGYGASVVWNNRLICVGGNDAHRRYAAVFMLAWQPSTRQVQTDSLPALPYALSNSAAAVAGDTLYVFGGESDRGTERSLYALSLRHPATGWQKRADLPGPARAYTTLVAHPNGGATSLYALGGRQTVEGKTEVFADGYVFRIGPNRWERLPDLPTALSAHGAVVAPDGSLLVVGGDTGERLGQIEQLNNQLAGQPAGTVRDSLTNRRNALQRDHPGFSRAVWAYDPQTKRWVRAGELPFAVPVTTPVVAAPGGFMLPSGEVSPGVRTTASWRVLVKTGK